MVHLCREVCGYQRVDGGVAAIAGWALSAADGPELCGKGCGATVKDRLQGAAPYVYRQDGEPDGADTGADAVPVSQSLLGRLSFWRVFQHAVFDPSGGAGDRESDGAALLHRDADPL